MPEDEDAHKRLNPAQPVKAALAESLVTESGKAASALDEIHLIQRLEILEAIVSGLEQRLSVLEHGQLHRLLLVRKDPPDICFQPPAPPKAPTSPAIGSIPECAEISKETQTEASVNDPSTASELPLGKLSTEAWRKGLTTNQLVARLKTNPTTLKKYLRDLKHVRWAVHRDPEGLGWVYHSPLQCYYPINVESDGDLSSHGLPTIKAVETLPEPQQEQDVARREELDPVNHVQLLGEGGLSQSEFSRLTGIPINTLQRWKHLPDCTERICCRTEGRYCYGYAKQMKRFYPLKTSSG